MNVRERKTHTIIFHLHVESIKTKQTKENENRLIAIENK